MPINFLNIISVIGISQGIFLAAFLLLKRGKALINLPLVIYIVLMTASLTNTLLMSEGISISLFGFVYVTDLCNLAYGVLIYIYTRNKIEGKAMLKRQDLWLLAPLVLYFIYYNVLYKDSTYPTTEYLNLGIEFGEHVGEWFFEVFINMGFLIASIHLLRNYHKRIKQNYSAIEKINFTVTRNLLTVCFIVYSFEALIILLLIIGLPVAEISYHIIYTLFILTLFAFGYNELIYSNSVVKEDKYKKSALKSDSSKLIADNLTSYMQEHKPYLNPDITLKNLAELIEEHPHILSQVINENFNQNYYEFINSYRIEEAKRMLKEPEYKNYTLTAIGFEAGFNSKSTFYTAFKKSTGVTPAKY